MKKIISKYKKSIHFIFLIIGMLAGIIAPLQKSEAQNKRLQQQDWCTPYTINKNALDHAKAYETANKNSMASTHYLLRVYFHIVRDDNGSNAGATETQVNAEFSQLSADYAANNICFANMGLEYINSTTLNAMNTTNSSSVSLLTSHNVPYCINIYYHKEIIGAGGSSYMIPNTYCSIKRLGDQTTSHEVGHCLGLLHTFETVYGTECINGSNSGTAGDGVTDTPADPWAYSTQPCFSQSGCVYTGSCFDPCFQSNFNPPYTNMMAYWQCSFLSITPFQFNRITGYLNTFPALINCESPQNANYGPVNFSSGYQIATAIDLFTTNGNVNLSGTAIATFAGGTVVANPGFHAYPSAGGLVLIRPVSCSFISLYAATSKYAGTENSEIIDQKIINKTEAIVLSCFPNPANGFVNIRYQLPVAGRTSITLLDITGRGVKIIQAGTLLSGGLHENKVDIGKINSGIYFVKMIYNGQTSVVKLVVAK